MHPQHEAGRIRITVGFEADLVDRFTRNHHRLANQFERKPSARVQHCDHPLRVGCDFFERFPALEVPASGEEPNDGFIAFHEWVFSLIVRRSFMTAPRSALRSTPPNASCNCR